VIAEPRIAQVVKYLGLVLLLADGADELLHILALRPDDVDGKTAGEDGALLLLQLIHLLHLGCKLLPHLLADVLAGELWKVDLRPLLGQLLLAAGVHLQQVASVVF
jgi:hypothetical protein